MQLNLIQGHQHTAQHVSSINSSREYTVNTLKCTCITRHKLGVYKIFTYCIYLRMHTIPVEAIASKQQSNYIPPSCDVPDVEPKIYEPLQMIIIYHRYEKHAPLHNVIILWRQRQNSAVSYICSRQYFLLFAKRDVQANLETFLLGRVYSRSIYLLTVTSSMNPIVAKVDSHSGGVPSVPAVPGRFEQSEVFVNVYVGPALRSAPK